MGIRKLSGGAISVLAVSVLFVFIQASPLEAQSSSSHNLFGGWRKPDVLAGVEITSSLRPAAKVDFWFPNSNIPGDVVMGIAGGRRGYEVSLGLGATCSDGDHHADARALVTRARGQTSIGAEFTPYMFMVQRRTWLRFGVGAVHTIGDSRPIEFRWSAGALFHLAH